MILKSELTGAKLKRDLGLKSAKYRWHNKNKSGGNFGINLIAGDDDKDSEIDGMYNTKGEVVTLSVGAIYQPGARLSDVPSLTYEKLIEKVKEILAAQKACDLILGAA